MNFINYDKHLYESISSTSEYYADLVNQHNQQINSNSNTNQLCHFYKSLLRLHDIGWYWGDVSYNMAEKLLKPKPNGSFLLRDSKHDRYLLTLSFKVNDSIYHVRMEHISNGKFSFHQNFAAYIEPQEIINFMETAVEKSKTGHVFVINPRVNAPAIDVSFLYPVSRFKDVPVSSLQHIARFAILKRVRKDHIDKLSLPNKLKDYLKMSQIFTELETN